ncbi:carbamoyltransferase C-terminal domain-containing protein [Kitasatospora sp. NPDC096077]|uniref:carbamoyltransferase family protein n=1 Tax=Kitasatospora sp. NPDC096077 TaxID=3155544 RepID=UPI0033324388
MSKAPVVLGINNVYHESSAVIVRGSEVLAFAEEERFNRKKHAKPADIETVDEIPVAAIRAVLERSGVTVDEIDHIAGTFDPSLRRPPIDEPTTAGSWGHPDGEKLLMEKLAAIPTAVSELLGQDIRDRWTWVPHETAHAASTYFASPFEDAAILSIDGIGEHSTALLAHGKGRSVTTVDTITYPDSLGFVWEKFAKFTGLDDYSAPKLMALAAFAPPEKYREAFAKLVSVGPEGFTVDADAFRFRVEDYGPLEELFGPRRQGGPGTPFDYRYAEVAASLQEMTEQTLFALAERLKRETGSANLCLAGGVALNCVGMGKLLNEGPFDGVFVQPLAHDGGTALGAALWVANQHGDFDSRFVMENPYFGSAVSTDAEIEAAIAAAPVVATKLENAPAKAAELVAQGLVIGWFQGAAEVGPRALGNRSLVGDPRTAGIKDLINVRVKHREYFRPFAPAVLEEEAAEWFDFKRESLSTRFMSFALPVREEKRSQVPAIVHVDGTARMQTVSAEVNPRYHQLISEFHKLTGVPVVVNTSFNTYDEPMVYTPADAIRTFLRTGMDALVLHDYLIERTSE